MSAPRHPQLLLGLSLVALLQSRRTGSASGREELGCCGEVAVGCPRSQGPPGGLSIFQGLSFPPRAGSWRASEGGGPRWGQQLCLTDARQSLILRGRERWGAVPRALSLRSPVTLGSCLVSLESWFPHLQSGDDRKCDPKGPEK